MASNDRTPLWVLPLAITIVAGISCNMPGARNVSTATLDATQAYQTVDVKLTLRVDQTPAISPTSIPTESGLATYTPTIIYPTAILSPAYTPSITAPSTKLCDQAAPGHPIDITIPDDSVLDPGKAFTKIWRLQNTGTCSWTQEYAVTFFSGERMSADVAIPIKGAIPPGNSVDITVEMIAPQDSGNYQGNWKLRNAANVLFGIGPNGSSPFWVRIRVIHTPTPSFTPVTPTPTHTPTATPPIEVSGSAKTKIGDKFDFDRNQINPDDGEDITLTSNNNGLMVILPAEETVFGIYGPNQPNPNQCLNTAMEASPITLDSTSIDNFYCYLTDEQRLGWAIFNDSDPDFNGLTLDFVTWSTP